MFRHVRGAPRQTQHLDEVRGKRGVHAKVSAHRLLDLRAVAHDHARERAKQRPALVKRRERVSQERGALAADNLVQLLDRRGIVGVSHRALLDGRYALSPLIDGVLLRYAAAPGDAKWLRQRSAGRAPRTPAAAMA